MNIFVRIILPRVFGLYLLALPALATNSNERCPLGSYSSTGMGPCKACPAGSYTKELGQKSCLPARAGYYVPSTSSQTEYACAKGTYSPVQGSTSCTPCPLGHMCPSAALAVPQQCSPGRYASKVGTVDCPKCDKGTFNNIHKATGCCKCAAGWFLDQPGNVNCQRCSNQYPYSDPGTGDRNGCKAKPGHWAPAPSSDQKPDGTCPASTPYTQPSQGPHKRNIRAPSCPRRAQKACPVYTYTGGKKTPSFECVDVLSDLESCGGCVWESRDGAPSDDGGRDCSAIPFVESVSCRSGECVIELCQLGFVVSEDGKTCVSQLDALRKTQKASFIF
ncbi:GCC2 and GCC3 family protein [Panaeolus papilionaceus]|nr:GCC2 and GCC3 family protein [Panaeolus papilionaceus]